MNLFKKALSKDVIMLGNKKVEIKKLTPALWKKIFSAIDMLPGIALQVFNAPRKDLTAYLLNAFDVALDEMVEIVSLISEEDAEYLTNEAGLDELVEYIFLTIKKNRLDQTVKNLKGLLPQTEKKVETE